VHLVGCSVGIYYDARTYERQIFICIFPYLRSDVGETRYDSARDTVRHL
jgi:hypothetical protein